MLSTAARSSPGSCVGCVSTWSCEPSAMTCARSLGLARVQHGERLALGIGQPRARAHAEGIVHDHQQELVAGHAGSRAVDERIRKRQRQQQQQRQPQRKQQQ